MKPFFLVRTPAVLVAARGAAFQLRAVWQVLIFIGLWLLSMVAMALPLVAYAVLAGNPFDESSPRMMVAALYATAFSILLFVAWVVGVERRPLASMGVVRRGALRSYLGGFGAGALLMCLCVGAALATGAMRLEGSGAQITVGMLLVALGGFMIQGMAEEVQLRGYLLVSLANRTPILAAVAISSVCFAALHLFNKGITVLAVVNLVLFGVFAAFYFLRTDNIWGIGALHSAWNFFQGNIFGIEVSGAPMGRSLVRCVGESGRELWSGGSFGIEGGLFTTAVFALAIALLLLWPSRSKRNNGTDNPAAPAYSVS